MFSDEVDSKEEEDNKDTLKLIDENLSEDDAVENMLKGSTIRDIFLLSHKIAMGHFKLIFLPLGLLMCRSKMLSVYCPKSCQQMSFLYPATR